MRPAPSNPRCPVSLRLGSIVLDLPVVQAALSGHSDWPMRMLARRHGAPYAIHEVMLERYVREVRNRARNRRRIEVTGDEHPAGAQLMGSDPGAFAPAARRLVEAGFDIIDINFGCPVSKAMGACRGGYHLGQPDVALQIVRTVRGAVPERVPVTVKMRRGIDDSAESRDKFFEILLGAFDAGVAAITVHGRTVEQRYVGPSRWAFLRDVKEAAGRHTILGSGDLFTPQACFRMMAQTGVDGVTVARGSIGNPWIFAQCRALAAGRALPPAPDVHEQRDVLLEHRALAETAFGAGQSMGSMLRFGVKCAQLHPEHKQVRNAFGRARRPSGWQAVLDTWYAENRPGRYAYAEGEGSGTFFHLP